MGETVAKVDQVGVRRTVFGCPQALVESDPAVHRREANTSEVSLDDANIRNATVNTTIFGRCRDEH
jgi:hypothetical protein